MDLNRASISVAAAVAFALYGPVCLAQATDASAQAAASSEDTGQLQEVVITAQKRTERLEDVPVSANVVSNTLLQQSNVSDVSDLNKIVPSININGTISGRAPMGIRGISSVSNEQAVGVPSGVAIMVDGVPVPSDSYDGNQIEDMQTVEVLEGPQATLGGRTAAAGVINYRTYDPTDHVVGGITGTATTDKEFRGSGHISGPLSDNLPYSLSAYDANRYYPITNTYYGTKASQRDWGVRAKLLWNITDNFSAKVTYHHATVDQSGFNFVYTYITPGVNLLGAAPLNQATVIGPDIHPSWTNLNYESPVNSAGHRHDDNDGQLDLNWDLGKGYTLTSTTAYQHESQRQVQDLFATKVYFFNYLITGGNPASCAAPQPCFNDTQLQIEKITQRSEEIKLVSPVDQTFSFVTGLFYSDTDVAMNYQRGFAGAQLNLPNVEPMTSTYDIYGRGTWKFTPTNSLVAGLRYNYDKLSYNYNQIFYTTAGGPYYSTGSDNSSALVGDVSLQHQFTPDVMGYATYARGYSPKVYNTAAQLTSDAPLTPVGQEHINHFELGLKGTYFNRTLSANVSVFDTIYNDYQINSYLYLPGVPTGILNINAAGKAETRGAELSTEWRVTPRTTLSANAAYIDAVFKTWTGAPCVPYYPNGAGGASTNCTFEGTNPVQDMSGQNMPNAPRWKFFLDGQQRIPLASDPYDVVLDANWAYRTSAQMLPDNDPDSIMGAFGIVNISAGLEGTSGKWTVTAFCNNLFNKIYYQDVEDFWSGPWLTTNPTLAATYPNDANIASSTVIAQPARDAVRYGGVRFTMNL